MFQIENDVPVPAGLGPITFPFADMEVGQSFVVPADVRATATVKQAVGKANQNADDRVYRAVALDNGDTRVWRVA